ncbi:MAG: hypothetical protein QOD35_1992 [Nocardioidaceae bacterium]|jgi:uncharacterized membrane protein|nr:hypothetical protein [Nocardioidaceae bacterium]
MSTDPATTRRTESRWPAAAAIAVVIAAQLALPAPLTFGSRELMPALEAVLLIAIVGTNRNQLTVASVDMRYVSLTLIGVMALANSLSLALLVNALLNGGQTSGRLLILAALGIWLTNVVVFALVYWELDRRGAHARSTGKAGDSELLFPQMTLDEPRYAEWLPVFGDYLYVSFTNSTAFSPTDTMPLSSRIKMAMLVQSLLSLVTIGLVGARAVNILG